MDIDDEDLTRINAFGYVLGHGEINSPRSVSIDGTYAFVGITDPDGEWRDIRPLAYIDGKPVWLNTLGPGRLVFIPDDQPPNRQTKKQTKAD